jgi:hypothetical protein
MFAQHLGTLMIALAIVIATATYAMLERHEYQGDGTAVMVADRWTGTVQLCLGGKRCYIVYPVSNSN